MTRRGTSVLRAVQRRATTQAAVAGYTFPIRISAEKRRFEDSNRQTVLDAGRHGLVADRTAQPGERDDLLERPASQGFQHVAGQPARAQVLQPTAEQHLRRSPVHDSRRTTRLRTRHISPTPIGSSQQAAQRGMVVLLAPSYAGYNGGNEGWYQEMKDERHHETAQLRALSGTAIRRLHQHHLGARWRLQRAEQGAGGRDCARNPRDRPRCVPDGAWCPGEPSSPITGAATTGWRSTPSTPGFARRTRRRSRSISGHQ